MITVSALHTGDNQPIYELRAVTAAVTMATCSSEATPANADRPKTGKKKKKFQLPAGTTSTV